MAVLISMFQDLTLGRASYLSLDRQAMTIISSGSSAGTEKLTLCHSLRRRLGCNLDHSSGLISSQLNKGDRVEGFEVNKLETGR
jgi:nucleoside-triphosphatase THEP1